MRLPFAIVLALAGSAHADGGYLFGEMGGTGFRGDLHSDGNTVRLRGGAGVVLGDLSIEAWGAGDVANFFFIDCYAAECAAAAPAESMSSVGLDVRKNFTLLYGHPPIERLRWFNPRLQAFLHAGVRYGMGEDSIQRYAGPGLGAGAGLEVNVRIFTAYIDLGADRYALAAPGSPTLDAQAFHIVLGERIGFSL